MSPRRPVWLCLCLLIAAWTTVAPGAATGHGSVETTTDPRFAAIDWVVDSALAQPHLRGADVAILMESLSTGEVLYERNPDLPMIPASNMKAVTGAAALHVLGPDFAFETVVATDRDARGPTLGGNLYVSGSGDPSLVSEELWKLVEEIRVLGIRRVEGDLVLDAGRFDARTTTSAEVGDGDRAYHARIGALSLNFNAIAVYVSPGERPGEPALVRVSPGTSFVDVRNRAKTGRQGGRSELSVRRTFENARNVITVEGSVPSGSGTTVHYRNLDDVPGYFGTVLREFLAAAGIEIGGEVVGGSLPDGTRVLVTHRSKPLALIVRDLNKYSNNFVAEQLLKALGAEIAGPPGTTAAGTAALRAYLSDSGADSVSYRVVDGSGFSRNNRLSPRDLVLVMKRGLSDFSMSYEYAASLSVSGTDGTLKDRMGYPGLMSEVRAKTGLLDGVTAISGIVNTASGEQVLFSIIVNGFTCEAWRAHDLEHAILAVASRA
ncbi:MAG: D-alanyl-D-alanine carboxypeptidase/D-alanyl-D-alanine-endopeptidase [Candidatus Eisenbacteria bacterium]|nr:D-alanyl-D-alanine carboxypeptidase/D-alanyl-D-alanine-endopeptidase [Candidatus Eisenbacteria bacterium]